MQQLPESAAFQRFVAFGVFVMRSLTQSKLPELADKVRVAYTNVKAAGRDWEDTEEGVQVSLADRNLLDGNLDRDTQSLRAELAGRFPNAAKHPPVTLIFPDGIDHYIRSPLDEQVTRYNLLISRIETHLPPEDGARQRYLPPLKENLAAWPAASAGVDAARNTQTLARDRLQQAIAEFRALMDKVYHEVAQQTNASAADRLFPRA